MKLYSSNKKAVFAIDGKCKPVILLGDEGYLKRDFINNLLSDLNKESKTDFFQFDLNDMDFDMFRNLVNVQSLLSTKKLIHISGDPKVLSKTVTIKKPKPKKFTYEELILDSIANAKQNVYLVIEFNSLDKRKKLHKEISKSGLLLEVNQLSSKELIGFISDLAVDKESSIKERDAKYLLSLVEPDMYLIESEMIKLSNYTDVITKREIDMLVVKSAKVAVFDLIDFVADKKQKEAVILLDSILSQNNSPFQILTLLSMHYQRLLCAKIYPNHKNGELAKMMKCSPMFVDKYKQQVSKMSFKAIERSMKLILEVEIGLKSGYNDVIYLNWLIEKLSKGGSNNVRRNSGARR